jgi:multiple sugar transport system substrate-binding protein
VRLVYWSSQNPQELDLALELVGQWNAENPGVQVTLQPIPAGQSSEEVLLAAIVGRTTPDVCSNIWPGILADFVRAGGVVRLDTLAGFDSLLAARVPPHLHDAFRSPDGDYYQVPWKTNPILMLYNRGLFREAGLDRPPRTYSEYLAAGARLTQDTDGDGQTDRWIGYRDIRPVWWQRYFDYYPFYIAASGGKTLFDAHGNVSLDQTASNRVFGFFQTVFERGYFPVTTFQDNPFLAQRIATEFTGPWSAAYLAENAPASLDYDYAPLPVPDGHAGPVYTYGDYKNIALFSTTKHPREAWRFVQFLVSEAADRRLVEVTRQIPLRQHIATDPGLDSFYTANPAIRRFAEAAAYTRGVDAVPQLQEVLDAVAQGFERAVYRAETPAEATASTQRRIRLIADWAR